MKLTYYKDSAGNFGDDLNPWLWDQLLPGVLDEGSTDSPDNAILLGLGTIMERWFCDKLPVDATKIVIGSGGGMTAPPPTLDADWRVYCVRGPLTAAYLGLGADRVATDPAMCVRDLWPSRQREPTGIGFMPHHRSSQKWDWRKMCELIGLQYIDPHAPPLDTLAEISTLRKLITEAMHGAIVADALRVPWMPLRINETNYTGKWDDWSASIRTPIHFKPLPDLLDPFLPSRRARLIGSGLRSAARQMFARSSARDIDRATQLLRSYSESEDFSLSADQALEGAIDRFLQHLEAFKEDWRAGLFSKSGQRSSAPS